MDNKEVRRRNVKWLSDQADGPTAFGKQVDRDQVQVSQWIGGKPIGDRLARHIESKLGKPAGWLDSPQWAHLDDSGTAAPMSHSGRPDPEIIADTHRALLRFMRRRDPNATLDLSDPEDAVLFADVFAVVQANDDPFEVGAQVEDLLQAREAKRERRKGKQDRGDAGTEAGEAPAGAAPSAPRGRRGR